MATKKKGIVEDIRDPKINTGPGFTVQEDKDKVDINNIVAGHRKTGAINHLAQGEPFYGDVSQISGFQEALDVVNQANELFMQMPAKARDKFANNPNNMIKFLQDPKNIDEAIQLGMVVPKIEENKKAVENNQKQTEKPKEDK